MKTIFYILSLLCFSTQLFAQEDTTTAKQDSIEFVSITIDDLKKRAEDAKVGVYYDFKSKDEEEKFYKYVNSKVIELENKLSSKSAQIDSLRKIVAKYMLEEKKHEEKLKSGWRKLKMYMSIPQVEKLMGKPDAITKTTTFTKYWYGNGFIEFNAFKKVSEWAESRKYRTEVIEY